MTPGPSRGAAGGASAPHGRRSHAHSGEPHRPGQLSSRLNWLRAGVLGANDGIVSTAGLVVGVAGAATSRGPLVAAGVAGLVSGAVSMALGEYVSVSSQRDTERSLLDRERQELAEMPQAELEELAGFYRAKGISDETAHRVAKELTARDPLGAHAEVELGIDPDELANPWHAAGASGLSFTLGAILPLLAIVLPPATWRVPVTVVVVLVALAITGWISARLGGAPAGPAMVRLVVGGGAAMGITFAVGDLIGDTGLV